ncbi:hypothetical protein C9374_008469 [Naegleria lovaniensis]|uniref:VWFA domain-containing protein n=1 Tax=Naegleria lovaniensis TaxID=51637 RepID=A0AA88KHM2_NAELO|nr:uncharacterized protein C9374_008469 [Naegleria lovaniensis]KAG2378326.1 hypothetical protein C9374_008469 [Naegleria lovaniensis]
MPENITLGSTTAARQVVGFNLSLLKGGTITQTIVGGIITSLVIASTVATIILVSVGVGYSPPEPKNDVATTFKRVPVTLDVLLNDVDPRGGNLTLTNIVVNPRFGIAKIISKSKIMYQSVGAFTGNDTFSYEVSNSFMTANATVTIQVLNRAPEAIPIVKTVPKNANRFVIDIFSYVGDNGERISDVDNDALYVDGFNGNHIVGGNDTNLGIVEKDTWTGFYYTPKKDFNGVEQFNYVISDGNDTSTSTITVSIQNNAPTCADDTFQVPKYRGATLDVLKNDIDINGDEISITRALGAGFGGVSVRNNSKVVYYYTSGDLTTKYGDSFEYSITDGQLESSCVVFVQVYNTPPDVFTRTVTVTKSTTDNLIPIHYFDVDRKDLITLKKISPALNSLNPAASVQLAKSYETLFFECCDFIKVEINNYTIVFTPTPNTVYTTTLDITMTDGEAEGTGKLTINVVNTPPTAVDDTATCGKNLQTLINVIENDFDTDNGDTALLKLTTNGWIAATEKGGSVSLFNNTHVLYTAPKDLVGTTDVAYYRVTDQSVDGSGQPDPTGFATGKITISLINNPPTPVDDVITIPKGIASVLNVLANDVDPNDGPSSVKKIKSVGASEQKNISPSILVNQINGDTDAVSYTAINEEYTDSFLYDVTDKDGMDSTYKAKVTLQVVNTAPVANNDNFNTKWNRSVDCDVKANDADQNGDLPRATVIIVSQPTHGSAVVMGDKVRYTPTNGYVGSDSFTYKLNDLSSANAESNVATVTIQVTNTAPITQPDTTSSHWRNPVGVLVSPLDNDSDPDGDALVVSAVSSSSSVGTATLIDSQTVKFVPSTAAPITLGAKQFTYTVSDYNLQTTGTVNVEITNTKPVGQDDAYSMHWAAGATSLTVLKNDVDANDDYLSVGSIDTTTYATKGTVVNSGSAILYTPRKDGVTDKFAYYPNDGAENAQSPAVVTVSFTNNEKPTADDASLTIHWRSLSTQGGKQLFDVLTKTVDADGDAISLSVTASSSCAKVNNAGKDKVQVSVSNGVIGTTNCPYTVSDGLNQASATVSVITTNNVPTCSEIVTTFNPANFDNGQQYSIASYVSDEDANDIAFLVPTGLSGATGGDQFYVDPVTNNLVFKPTKTVAVRTLYYKVTDSVGTSASCMFKVSVNSISPSDYTKRYDVHWNANDAVLNILDTFPSSNIVSITPGSMTGTASISGRTILYTPKRAVGFDTFIVNISDGVSNYQITVEVTVYNNAPTATVAQSTTTWSSTTGVTIDLLANYADSDYTAGRESLGTVTSLITTGTSGSVTLQTSRYAKYLPQGTFTGYDQFKAVISDGLATVTVTATVLVTNTPPTTVPKSVSIKWSQHKAGYAINVLNVNGATDSDAENNPLTATVTGGVSPSSAGTVQLTTSPTATVRSGASVFLGTFSFSYSASDSIASTPGSVSVTVTNTLPTPSPQSIDLHWRSKNVPLDPVVSYAPTRQDADGDSLTITAASAQKGTATANTNTITYSAPASLGLDVVSYTLTDGAQSVSNANTVVNVNVVNTNPTAAALTASGKWSAAITKDLTGACTDSDSLDTTFVKFSGAVSNAVGGTTAVSGNVASFTSTLAASSYSLSGNVYSGTGGYKYTCTDGLGTSQGTVTVTVTNNAPTGTGGSVTVPRDYTKTTYDFTWAQMGTFSDADGDSVSVIKVATSASGVTVSTTASGIRLTTTSPTVVGAKAITFKLFDGLHESVNTLTFTVTFTNAAPTCSAASFNVNKGTSTDVLPTLRTLIADANNDALSVSLTGTFPSSLGSFSGTVFTSATSNSGSSSAVSYIVSDTQLSNTCGITITVSNRAPTAPDTSYSFTAVSNNYVHTATYNLASDPDADAVSYSLVSNDCSTIATSVTVSSAGLVTFTRKSSVIVGSCSLVIRATDNDASNPLSDTANVQIVLQAAPPAARDDRFSINQGQTIRIFVSQMFTNDNDEFGQTTGLSFVSTSCPDASYCHKTPRVVNVNGQTAIELDSDSNTCQADKFRYTAVTSFGTQVSANVFVEFKNCYCQAKIDFVFLLDSSGSIGTSNFNSMRDFCKRITGRFKIGPDAVQVGIARFHTTGVHTLALSTDGTLINNTLTNMYYDAGNTATIPGLRVALNIAAAGRADADKVIYILTDGLANEPCSCLECEAEWAIKPSVYKYTVQQQIIDNTALTSTQKKTAYQNMCKYQFSDTSYAFSGKTCSYCAWTTSSYCLPCADAVPIAKKINSWKRNSQGIVPNDLDNPFNGNNRVSWKIVAMAVGNAMANNIGARQIQGMNYDPSRAMTVSWNDLQSVMTEIVDQSCNTNDVQIAQ